MIEASVLASQSGDCLYLQIWDGENLKWSHMYLGDGGTTHEYFDILRQIKADAENCAGYAHFDGCDRDDEGQVYDVRAFYPRDIYRAATFANGQWDIGGGTGGSARDFIKIVMRDGNYIV